MLQKYLSIFVPVTLVVPLISELPRCVNSGIGQIPSSDLFDWDVVEPPRHSGFMYQVGSTMFFCMILCQERPILETAGFHRFSILMLSSLYMFHKQILYCMRL